MNALVNIDTDNPHKTFGQWLEEAKSMEINDHNAMSLATADKNGRPSNRMVLLNGHDERGFVFYTNAQATRVGIFRKILMPRFVSIGKAYVVRCVSKAAWRK